MNPEHPVISIERKRKMAAHPGNPGAHRIVKIRRAVQVGTFLLFVLFFAMTTSGLQHVGWIPKNLFMSMDFLNTLKNSIASHHVSIPALGPGLLILLLTLVGGRIFCGWICPLGTTIDIADRYLFRRGKPFYNPKRSETHLFRNWKFIYLITGLGAIVFGVDILAYGDPLSLITRTFTWVVYGPVAYIWNGLIGLGEQIGIARVLNRGIGLDTASWYIPKLVYYGTLPALLMFVGLIALSSYQERFWCRNLCPYGALLGLISRISILRHYINQHECIHCVKCENLSRMGAYDNMERQADHPATHDITECIQCFRCETICPPDVIQISVTPPVLEEGRGDQPAPLPPMNVGRRRILQGIGVGVLLGTAAKSGASNYLGPLKGYPRNNKAVRPPGALPERQFLSACTRCAECMKVCPTNALQPAVFETGMEGIWTPILVPAIGPCAERCTACGDICPTGAIRPFTWQDKRYKLRLGLASVNQNTCIAHNGGRDCVVCAEVCPYSAVVFRDVYDDTLPKDPAYPISDPGNRGRRKRVPTVDEKLCTGCGICEFQCPVLPEHAIVVYTLQEDRQYRPPKQNASDGIARPGWNRRKETGKDAEYKDIKERFQRRIDLESGGGVGEE
jgi:polyferredoxin